MASSSGCAPAPSQVATTLPHVGRFLFAGEVKRLALANQHSLSALRNKGLWRFETLCLDMDKRYHPGRIFERIATDEVVFLWILNFGALLFRELAAWSFTKLRRVHLTGCLFETAGAEAVARLVRLFRVPELSIVRCFLKQRDLAVLASSVEPLQSLAIAEEAMPIVRLGPALDDLLGGATSLQALTLRGRIVMDEGLAAAIGRLPALRALRILDNPTLRDASVRVLCASLGGAGGADGVQLDVLDLSAAARNGVLTDASGRAIADALSAGLGVRELSVAGHRMSKAALAWILARGGGQLQRIDLTGNAFDARRIDDDELMASCAKASVLEVLCVGGACERPLEAGDCSGSEAGTDEAEIASVRCTTQVGAIGAIAWAAALPALVSLDVSGAFLDDEAVRHFGAEMARDPSRCFALQELDLSRNLLTECAVPPLLEGVLRGRVRLQRLDLGVNSIGDEGCARIGAALATDAALATLTHLSLRENAIGHIPRLGEAVAASRLRELDFRENLLNDSDAKSLLAACAPRHTVVRLEGNELSEEAMAGLGIVGTNAAEVDAGSDDAALGELPAAWKALCFGGAKQTAPRDAWPETSEGAAAHACRGTVPPSAEDERTLVPSSPEEREDAWPETSEGAAAHACRGTVPPSAEDERTLVPSSAEEREERGAPTMAVSAAEWRECVESLAWMESMLRDVTSTPRPESAPS